MKQTVYFDANYVALGASEGPEAYYGGYFISRGYDLPEGTIVTGRNIDDLADLHRKHEEEAVPKYPVYIMEKVRQHLGLEHYDTSRDAEINEMSHSAVLDHALEWEGIIGYGGTIRGWIETIYGVKLE